MKSKIILSPMRLLSLSCLALIFLVVNKAYSEPVPPTTVATYHLGYYAPNQAVLFDASGSHDNDGINGGQTPHWDWTFYDCNGTIIGASHFVTTSTKTWSFPQAGMYTVYVTYYDDDGQAGNTVAMTIEIGALKTYYYLKDHIGNVKMTVDAGGNVVGYDDYYPFGGILPGRSNNSGLADAKYKFTGKERDVETNLDYFGARYYDSWRGQWLAVDPHEGNYLSWSPYHYGADNPLKVIELDGRDYYYTENGQYLGHDDKKTQFVFAVSDGSWSGKNGSYIVLQSGLTQLFDNQGSPFLNDQFRAIAGTLYSEDASTWETAAGIYSTMENRANANGTSTFDEASAENGYYGWARRGAIDSKNADKNIAQNAFHGLIRGILDSKDYSGGGYFAHGVDFGVEGTSANKDFYSCGFEFTDPGHDIWGLGNIVSGNPKWDYKYESTGASGKTTFMKLTPEWQKATGGKRWNGKPK